MTGHSEMRIVGKSVQKRGYNDSKYCFRYGKCASIL